MTNETVCGYTNWHTFTLALYADNDERLYDKRITWYKRLRAKEITHITAASAHSFAITSGLTEFCRRTEREFRTRQVDWRDIADSWQTDYEEFLPYEDTPDADLY